MILALDDDVPDGGRRGDPGARERQRPLDDPPGRRRADRARRSRPGLDATLVLVRHGESEFIVEGRFQGQAETPLSATGSGAGGTGRRPARRPGALPRPADPRRRAHRDRPLAAGRAARDRERDRRRRIRTPPEPRVPDPRLLEIGQGDWEGLHRDEIDGAVRRRAGGLAAPPDRGLGARRRVARPRSRSASGSGLATMLARPRSDDGAAGRLDPVAGYGGHPGRHAVERRRRPRRRLQGHAADAVRPAARAVLDVVVGPVRDHGRRAPRRSPGPARPQPDRPPRAGPRRARELAPSAPPGRRPGHSEPTYRRRRSRRRNARRRRFSWRRRSASRRALQPFVAEDPAAVGRLDLALATTVSSSGRTIGRTSPRAPAYS